MRLPETITHGATRGWAYPQRIAVLVVLVGALVWGAAACGGDESGGAGSDVNNGSSSADLTGGIRSSVTVGDAVITVESLQAAFQPVSPAQRLSDEALVAPAAGITFYQAIVHIENRGQVPLRIDPEDFFCLVGNTVSTLEPTRSGPAARSIIFGTSLDLLLTFRGEAGAEPKLIYRPPWYSGIITFGVGLGSQTGGATGAPTTGQATTTIP